MSQGSERGLSFWKLWSKEGYSKIVALCRGYKAEAPKFWVTNVYIAV